MNRLYRKLPEVIQAILLISEGWLVGAAPKQLVENQEVKDYDIIVPSRELHMIAVNTLKSMTDNIKPNSFGGLKAQVLDIEIDIWCEELDHFIKTANKLEYIYNMKRNILLKNINE